MASEELLQEFMLEYDDVYNIGRFAKYNKVIWKTLIYDKKIWQQLEQHWHNNDNLIRFLISLNKADSELYFRFGIECMIAFLQENFTGPTSKNPICRSLLHYKSDKKYFRTALSENGEQLHPLAAHAVLLFVAKHIFKFCNFHNSIIQWWWQLRAIMIHQNVLQELTQSLFTEAEDLRKRLVDLPIDRRWRALLEIEQAQLFIHFRNVTLAQKHLDKAGALLGIVYEIRREVTPQPVDEELHEIEEAFMLVYFCDDTVARPPIRFGDSESGVKFHQKLPEIQEATRQLPDLEQKFLLGVLQKTVLSRTNRYSYYVAEPFIYGLLTQKNTWAVRSQLLYCLFVFMSKLCEPRTKEGDRAPDITTLLPDEVKPEQLLDNMQQNSPCVLNRASGVFACNLVPCWKRKEIIADIIRLSGNTNAITWYLEAHYWSQAIKLYRNTNELHELSKHIRNKIEQEKDDTVALWCWLGDAENDVSYYEKAWELSEQTSSQVQRHLGYYYYYTLKDKFQECLEHFAKSLAINPLQPEIWYYYGRVYYRRNKWEEAIKAFQHVTCLEPYLARGWYYLGLAQEKIGNKVAAYDTLEEALKHETISATDSDIWSRFMILCIHFEKYSQGFHAYQRVAELKKKALFNLQALKCIVKGVQANSAAIGSRHAHQDLNRVIKYISETARTHRGSGFLSAIHALVMPTPQLKIISLISAARDFANDPSWSNDVKLTIEVLQVCLELAENIRDKIVEKKFIPEIKKQITTIMKQINRKVDADFEYFFNKLEDLLKIMEVIE